MSITGHPVGFKRPLQAEPSFGSQTILLNPGNLTLPASQNALTQDSLDIGGQRHNPELKPPQKGWKQKLEARFLLRSDDVRRFPEDVRICNFHRVDSRLLRGAMPQSELTFEKLKHAYHVKTIIDLRGPETTDDSAIAYEKTLSAKYGIQYVRIPMSSRRAPTDRELTKFLQAVQSATDHGGKAYVHCKHGIDRTGVMVAAYEVLMGKSQKVAYQRMQKYGFNAIHKKKCPAQRRFVKSALLESRMRHNARLTNFTRKPHPEPKRPE